MFIVYIECLRGNERTSVTPFPILLVDFLGVFVFPVSEGENIFLINSWNKPPEYGLD